MTFESDVDPSSLGSFWTVDHELLSTSLQFISFRKSSFALDSGSWNKITGN